MESLRSGVFLLPLFAMVVLGVQKVPDSHYGELDASALRDQHSDSGKNPVIVDPIEKPKFLEVPAWPLDLVAEPVQKKAKARHNPKKYQPPTISTSAAPTTNTTVEVSSTTTTPTPSTEMPSH